MPLFSIITVTYENLGGLQKTAASLTAQNFRDFEWIIIDGGSTDGTKDYLHSCAAQWLSEPDHGIYDAMNKGIARATGDYLIFMNAGDQFAAPTVLKHVFESMADCKAPPDFIYGDALEDVPVGSTLTKPARPHHKYKWGMFTHHQAMFYSRVHIEDIKPKYEYDTAYPIAADYKFTVQHIQKSRSILYITDCPLCIFESGGISQQRARQARIEQFKIRNEMKITSILDNIFIYIVQTCAYQLRQICPRLYWRFKSRRA